MARRRLDLAGQRGRAVAVAVFGGLAAGAVTVLFVGSAQEAWAAIGAPGPAGLDDGLLLAGCAVGAVLAAWLGLGLVLSALAALPGAAGALAAALADRLAPAVVRRAAAFLLGSTLTAAMVPGTAVAESDVPATSQPASTSRLDAQRLASGSEPARLPGAPVLPDPSFQAAAEPVPPRATSPATSPRPTVSASPRATVTDQSATSPSAAAGRRPADVAPDPSWIPERPAKHHLARPAPIDLLSRTASPGRSVDDQVVVRRGDTLWAIAARHLGPSASNAEIAGEWPRWFAANRAMIGEDANLLQPGQLLRPPSSTRGIP